MTARRAYEDTEVSETKSLFEIEKLLKQNKVLTTRWTSAPSLVRLEFTWPYGDAELSFRIDMVPPTTTPDGKWKLRSDQVEQEKKRLLRVLFYHIKAKLTAVEAGLVEMEREFLPYLLTQGNKTAGDVALGELKEALLVGRIPHVNLLPERTES